MRTTTVAELQQLQEKLANTISLFKTYVGVEDKYGPLISGQPIDFKHAEELIDNIAKAYKEAIDYAEEITCTTGMLCLIESITDMLNNMGYANHKDYSTYVTRINNDGFTLGVKVGNYKYEEEFPTDSYLENAFKAGAFITQVTKLIKLAK